ncbi:cytochrome c oxidase subunit II [Pseudoduganella flava]|uniref:cytochrome c oxidase subunit II n=1 Tax=Pseudoduganella flava TaxID=871742 RepID=UPI001E2A2357|nr:cytochrome c oxidase subunit II [Pseudoduganella flava]
MALAVVLVLIALGAVAFHFASPWQPTAIASNWQSMDEALRLTMVITGVAFVALHLFVAYAVVRYRHRAGHRASLEHGNRRLEWWLIGITTLGIIGLLAPGLTVYARLIDAPPDARVFEVMGQQWQWHYRLPGADGRLGAADVRFIAAANPFGIDPEDPYGQDDVLVDGQELHLPVGIPARAQLRAQDVLHDFYVPQFRTRMNMVPGMVTHFWFTPERTGRYEVLCAQLCGVGHSNMRSWVVIDEPGAYGAWLAHQPTFGGGPAVPGGAGRAAGAGQASSAGQGGAGSAAGPGGSAGPTGPPGPAGSSGGGGMAGKAGTAGAAGAAGTAGMAGAIGAGGTAGTQGVPGGPAEPGKAGRLLAQAKGCTACHSVDGSRGVGPSWKGLYGKSEVLQGGATVHVDEAYLRQSIAAPQAAIVQGYAPVMPPVQLSAAEQAALVDYIKTLR